MPPRDHHKDISSEIFFRARLCRVLADEIDRVSERTTLAILWGREVEDNGMSEIFGDWHMGLL